MPPGGHTHHVQSTERCFNGGAALSQDRTAVTAGTHTLSTVPACLIIAAACILPSIRRPGGRLIGSAVMLMMTLGSRITIRHAYGQLLYDTAYMYQGT